MEPLSTEELEGLTLLLKATSKASVISVIKEGFTHRKGKVPDEVLACIAQSLNISPQEVIKLFQSVMLLIRTVLYHTLLESAEIGKLFPDDFHGDLKKLVSDIIAKNISEWRGEATKNQVSLPRLVDFDWRVDIKSSSDSVARMNAPTCLVQMKVQPTPVTNGEMPPSLRSINVEFSRETLDTMLDGLGKIRDQLSSVAKAAAT